MLTLASSLSGIVSTQTYLYQKTYAADRTRNKFMVSRFISQCSRRQVNLACRRLVSSGESAWTPPHPVAAVLIDRRILDLAHSSFVIASVFHYLVGGYSDPTAIRFIAWCACLVYYRRSSPNAKSPIRPVSVRP